MSLPSVLTGLYRWSYKSGAFTVCLRPHGIFYCAKYTGEAQWSVSADSLTVNWPSYGIYEFPLPPKDGGVLEGYVQGNQANWRKMEYLRDFTAGEKRILGDGYGTAWDFQYEKGHFEIEFRCDGFNHFHCPSFPAHSHWTMNEEDGLIVIDWGQYGT